MMLYRTRRLGTKTAAILGTIGAACALGFTGTAKAASASADSKVSVFPGVSGPAAQKAVEDHWTMDAMRAVGGGSTSVPGAKPSVGDATGGEWPTGTAIDKTVGRLFSSYDGRNHSCTATLVDSPSGSVVATAAHCVIYQSKTGPATQRNFYFVPGYRDGRKPNGGFTTSQISVSSGWFDDLVPADTRINYDQAFLTLNTDAAGKTAVKATGAGQKLAYDAARKSDVSYLFGYPADSYKPEYRGTAAFNGNRVAACWGPIQVWAGKGDGQLQGVPCTQGAGISGGPRFVNFDPATGLGTLTGVVSADGPTIDAKGNKFPGDFGHVYTGNVTRPVFERAERAGLEPLLNRPLAHDNATTAEQDSQARSYWTTQRMQSIAVPTAVSDDAADGPRGAGAEWTGGGLVLQTIGRLFATQAGKDFSCTATVVASANDSTLVTAGHCAKANSDEPGPWSENVVFVPGYRDGTAPFGVFSIRRSFVPGGWDQKLGLSRSVAYDQAFMTVNKSGGKTVEATVGGHQNITLTGETGNEVYQFGYPRDPGNPKFSKNLANTPAFLGERLAYCQGVSQPDSRVPSAPLSGTKCLLGGGASGGPQMTHFDPHTGRGQVQAVNAFSDSTADAPNTYSGLFATLLTEAVSGPVYWAASSYPAVS